MTRDGQSANSCTMVLFGAGGDLAKRKLFPALFNLAREGLLPRDFALIGTAREPLDHGRFRSRVAKVIKENIGPEAYDERLASELVQRCHYFTGDSTREESYGALAQMIEEVRRSLGISGSVLFYLATPPNLFDVIPRHLAQHGLLVQRNREWRRVIFEKPFGHDLESARSLNRTLKQVMREEQIYRIDHYLGKETVQNIMALRFANGLFEPVWNRKYVDSVQITVSETLGVERRGSYYESAGALRDMVPNHLFQLISLIGMEPPISLQADDVRDEKVKVLRSICRLSPEEVVTHAVRGQYGAGQIEGEKAPAYRQEEKVDPSSGTETFVALKLEIDNWRWAGVPFYLRTGKRMSQRVTEAAILFKCAPFEMFGDRNRGCAFPNILTLQIQPKEQILLELAGKVPGPGMELGRAPLKFNYVEAFGGAPQTGYETLLYDCMAGDATLFQRGDQIEAAWEVVDPILEVWHALRPRDFPNYAAGSWGPRAAETLLEREGREWRIAPEAVTKAPPAVTPEAAKPPRKKEAA